MINFARRITENEGFQTFILFLILANALLMGLETYPEMSDNFEELFSICVLISQAVFVIEIALRVVAYGPRFIGFFRDFWNTFDFVVVAASLLPAVGSFTLVARLLRLLRALRIISVSDQLRVFVSSSAQSAGIVARGALVLVVMWYIFSICGFYLFSDIDPSTWGTLGRSFLSLFYLTLLQDVRAIIEPLAAHSAAAMLYFICFYIALLLLVLNVNAAVIAQYVRALPADRGAGDV